ncbi:MAG: NUDIX domain-containing protein [Actinobacteria bacterium]|nr:NUDIX domain-containing protein [Actinomycetota bacterium]
MGEREALQKMGRAVTNGPEAVAAATVILARPNDIDEPEILMLKRNSRLDFAGGLWVFPGGRIDPEDFDPAQPDNLRIAERRAAAREAAEEAGLDLDPLRMKRISHWTPPPTAHKRFSTAFFIAEAPRGTVVIDDGEIHDHRWATAAQVLAEHDDHGIELAPPTFITLSELAKYPTVSDLRAALERWVVESFATQIAEINEHVVALYHGDVGYGPDGTPDAEGPRHRLWLDPAGWRYERDTAPEASDERHL